MCTAVSIAVCPFIIVVTAKKSAHISVLESIVVNACRFDSTSRMATLATKHRRCHFCTCFERYQQR
jgi:hypothetical protein